VQGGSGLEGGETSLSALDPLLLRSARASARDPAGALVLGAHVARGSLAEAVQVAILIGEHPDSLRPASAAGAEDVEGHTAMLVFLRQMPAPE
jgi:hypothetical protein